jgi:hypothetical protein
MERRTFIKLAGGGLVLVGGANALLSTCNAMDRSGWRRSDYQPENIGGFSTEEIKILYSATLAPSGHNTQPWTVQVIEPGKWIIGSEKSRWLPAVDPQNRELLLSVGTFLENLTIAAHMYGYEFQVTITANDSYNAKLAGVSLKKTTAQQKPDERIATRRTIRSCHLNKGLLPADLDYLLPSLYKNQVRYYSRNSLQGKFIAAGTLEANCKQAFRDPAQLELSNWIRWSHTDGKKYRNGLTPDSMELHGIASWYVKNFYTKQSVLGKKFRKESVAMTKKQVDNCGGWLIVTSPSQSVIDVIQAGRILEQIWLRAADKKIAFHPMTQMLEESPWNETIRQELGISEQIQFIIRVSYVEDYPKPVSLRMPLTDIIK